jgi:hypothetical protein
VPIIETKRAPDKQIMNAILQKQYYNLHNQLKVLMLQNISQAEFDRETLLAINSLSRELIHIKQRLSKSEICKIRAESNENMVI